VGSIDTVKRQSADIQQPAKNRESGKTRVLAYLTTKGGRATGRKPKGPPNDRV